MPAVEIAAPTGSPNLLSARSRAAITSVSLVQSVTAAAAEEPSSSTSACAASPFRSDTTTFAPAPTRRRATAAPRPDAPPDTRVTRPGTRICDCSARRRKRRLRCLSECVMATAQHERESTKGAARRLCGLCMFSYVSRAICAQGHRRRLGAGTVGDAGKQREGVPSCSIRTDVPRCRGRRCSIRVRELRLVARPR